MKPRKKSKKLSRKARSSTPETMPPCVPSTSSVKVEKSPSPSKSSGKKRKLYNKEQLLAAYKAVMNGAISVNAASKQFGVPLTTLRDRVDGRINLGTVRSGPPQLLAEYEEQEIAHFLHTMARYGYRYTRLEIGEIATDQAVEKGKKNPNANGLTTKWVDNFVRRWPSIKELSFKFKNRSDAEHTVRTYFDEIKKIIDRYKLLEHSDRVFNIMEVGLDTDHSIAQTKSGKSGHRFKTENVSHTTMIACGSVSGKVMAPFFIFQAARLQPEMMRGVPSNVNAAVSDSGRCTPQIFRRYLNEHFLPQTQRLRDSDPILVLMDGSRSHIFVSLAEWGRVNNVIFSFVPALTTHLLQPLEVECTELIQQKYESVCRRYLKTYSGPCVSRNRIAELACQAYFKVLNRHSLVQAFKKAGVFPDISSDESEEEDDTKDDVTYRMPYVKAEDPVDDQKDEVVFTGDLVVGNTEEITEEEVVTQEMVLADVELDDDQVEEREELVEEEQAEKELVMTADGQLMMKVTSRNGHVVFHEGGELSQVELMECDEVLVSASDDISKISPLKQRVMNDDSEGIDGASVSVLRGSSFDPDGGALVGSYDKLGLISPSPDCEEFHLSQCDNGSNMSHNSSDSSLTSGLDQVEESSLLLPSSLAHEGDHSDVDVNVKRETI